MKIEIRNALNGVVLKIDREGLEEHAEEIVYQATDDPDAEVEAFADFLRFLLEEYGPVSSRYSPKRIHVIVEPGDKYESPA